MKLPSVHSMTIRRR